MFVVNTSLTLAVPDTPVTLKLVPIDNDTVPIEPVEPSPLLVVNTSLRVAVPDTPVTVTIASPSKTA